MTRSFERLVVPETFTVTTGADEEQLIWDHKYLFFGKVRKSLGMAAVRFDTFFREEYIAHLRDGNQPTDNWSYLLTLEGRQPVAQVSDWRNDLNNHVVSFGTYPLSPMNAQYVRQVIDEVKKIE